MIQVYTKVPHLAPCVRLTSAQHLTANVNHCKATNTIHQGGAESTASWPDVCSCDILCDKITSEGKRSISLTKGSEGLSKALFFECGNHPGTEAGSY